MRPLSSEWPLWSEVRTILPLKLWHWAQVAAEKQLRQLLVSVCCLVASAFFSSPPKPQLSPQQAHSARITSPTVFTFLPSRLLLARSLEIRVESLELYVCTSVCTSAECVLREDSLLCYRNASKAGARFRPIHAKPRRIIKQQPVRGISPSLPGEVCARVWACMRTDEGKALIFWPRFCILVELRYCGGREEQMLSCAKFELPKRTKKKKKPPPVTKNDRLKQDKVCHEMIAFSTCLHVRVTNVSLNKKVNR